MKRVLSLILVVSLLLLCVSCGSSNNDISFTEDEDKDYSKTDSTTEQATVAPHIIDSNNYPDIEFTGLNDDNLLRYLEDSVYDDLVLKLNSSEYLVEDVTAVFISKEYLEELSFNSRSNVFFGYSLNELDEYFEGSRYVFTMGEDGSTIVTEQQEITDNTYHQAIINTAIGTGIILLAVTVSVLTDGAAAPAVVAIFSASAKTGAICALSSGLISGLSAGIVKGYQTSDLNEALKAAAKAGSKGYMLGAIFGTILGAGKEILSLKAATNNYLSMNDVARIQSETRYPKSVISQIHSMEEYEIYKSAGLNTSIVNGKTALIQGIDLEYQSQLSDGTIVSNLARMQRGLAPIDPQSGTAMELHHIGQVSDGTLAVLTPSQHRGEGNFAVLHRIWEDSTVDHGLEWTNTRMAFWQSFAAKLASNGS